MNEFLKSHSNFNLNPEIKSDWWKTLKEKVIKNKSVIKAFSDDTSVPLNYYAAYAQVK